MRRIHTIDDGFTLVELLVTLALLTISLMGLAALQVTTIRQVTGSKHSGEATRLAESVLERYRSTSVDNLPADKDWQVEFQRDSASQMRDVGVGGAGDGPFTVERLVEPTSDGALVSVRVTWRAQGKGPARTHRVLLTCARIR
jgi:prepilin-type N-terminal cleavage/methylation domain-containing protein